MLPLTSLVTGFKIRSKKLLNLLFGDFCSLTVGFKSLGSGMVISTPFCSLIALCKISDLCILEGP